MKQRPRIYYSDAQKALMWERWKQGATLHEIAKRSIARTRLSTGSCLRAVASGLQSECARVRRCHLSSAKRSPVP